MNPRRFLTCSALVAVALVLVACSAISDEPAWKKAVAGDGPGNLELLDPVTFNTNSVVVNNLPKSLSGNRAEYEVFGVSYAVLDTARGFKEQGVASWYGSKFHGNATASGEIYNMHQMTAAHKHLPLPTFVRVTRIDNGQSIIVKVNDRGPFVGDRIIDLSYAAAVELDMIKKGKAEVLIEALSHHEPAEKMLPVQSTTDSSDNIQIGAFSDVTNADELIARVDSTTELTAYLEFERRRQLYLVRIGPLQNGVTVDAALQKLSSVGIEGFAVSRSVH